MGIITGIGLLYASSSARYAGLVNLHSGRLAAHPLDSGATRMDITYHNDSVDVGNNGENFSGNIIIIIIFFLKKNNHLSSHQSSFQATQMFYNFFAFIFSYFIFLFLCDVCKIYSTLDHCV